MASFGSRINGFFFKPRPNGNGHALAAPVELKAAELPQQEAKQSGVSLTLGPLAPGIDFFGQSDPVTHGIYNENLIRFSGYLSGEADRVTRATAYAAAAYAHVAIRYRMRKMAEPPLYVAQADADGNEEAVDGHALELLLEEPHPDYDMGELLQRTQAYRDIDGSALWVKDLDRAGRTGRLTPFAGSEFQVEETRSRIRGNFKVTMNGGDKDLPPERVVYFHEVDPSNWQKGVSLLDVALSWLNLGQTARNAVRDILRNAIFPSTVIQTDPNWRPAPESPEWIEFKQLVLDHANSGQKGEPLVLTGGGRATVVTPRLRDMIPGDILDRVESVVSSVFGIPSIVLQFQIGMENSPWSQMGEARRMCYEDTIVPLWREYEKALTRQLLRAPVVPGGQPIESNRKRFIRFDTSKVPALQADRKLLSEIQEKLKDIASTDERREIVLLEPTGEPEHQEVPKPLPPPDPNALPPKPGAPPAAPAAKAIEMRDLQWKRFDAFALGMEASWQWDAERLLEEDKAEALRLLAEHPPVGLKTKEGAPEHLEFYDDSKAAPSLRAILSALEKSMRDRWNPAVKRLVSASAQAAVAQAALDVGISFDLAIAGIEDFIQKEAAFLITSVTDTTRQAVRDALTEGLLAGEPMLKLRDRIADAGAFSKSRALLIARTETTRVTNGAQEAGLNNYVAAQEGVLGFKEWLTAGDHRVRPDHDEMGGKEVPINAQFDTPDQGLVSYPSAPNCRCTLIYRIARA